MRRLTLLIGILITSAPQFVLGGETIVLGKDGSLSGRFQFGHAASQALVLRFGLPPLPATRQWADNGVLQNLWVANGIRYTQTVLLTSIEAQPSSAEPQHSVVLFVNIQGENTNPEYTDADAAFAVQLNGKPQYLELKNGFISQVRDKVHFILCALEIPQSGVKRDKGEELMFHGHMPPAEKGSMTFKIPLYPLADTPTAQRLADLDFQAELRRFLKTSLTNNPPPPRLVFESGS